MKCLLLPIGLCVSAFLTLNAGAAPAPEALPALELPVGAEVLKKSEGWAYGLYMNGTKAGWAVIAQGPGKLTVGDCVTFTMQMNMEMKALGNTVKVEETLTEHYDAAPPHRALVLENVRKMDGQERRLTLRLNGEMTYGVEVREAGKVRTAEDVKFDLRLTHRSSVEAWLTDPQRKAGDAAGSVEFDFESMQLKPQNMKILKESEWTGPGGKLPVWEMELYDFGYKMAAQSLMSRADGGMVNMTVGQLVELRLEPEAVAKQKPGEAADLFLAMSVKSDKKLGRAAKLTEVELELKGDKDAKAPDLPETANQSVVRQEDGSVMVKITRGGGKPVMATAEDRMENLKATLRYPTNQAEVKKLAAKAAGGAANDAQKVKNLLRFTDNYLRDSYEVEALTVMDLLKSKKGECSAHALLFTTLARAAGIPAREAGGWYYMGDSYQAFGGHAWNEVILDGHWVPVDAIFQQIQLDAGHIQGHAGEMDGKALDAMTPGLKAKVLKVERE